MSVEATVDLLKRLVAYPTVSSDSNMALISDLAQRFEDMGARCSIMEDPTGQKANLLAEMGPDAPGGLLLSGHADVVPAAGQEWSGDPFALREAGGRLYGRGTCDMKGFIAAAVTTAATARPRRPLRFAFSYDEEVGCLGARAMVPELERRGIRPDIALVGEPTGMAVIEGHKGCCEYTARFYGKAGHGSDPGRGVNAVEYAARYAARLIELRAQLMARAHPDSPFEPPWTTLNVGRISGGAAHNVIAERAEVDWEMRPVTAADADFVRADLHRLTAEMQVMMQAIEPSARIETVEIGDVAGLMPMARNDARDMILQLLGQGAANTVPFNTEAGLFQGLGAHVVVCGPGHIAQAHTADEYIERNQISACLDLLGRLMTQA